jgi:hypothetical protein
MSISNTTVLETGFSEKFSQFLKDKNQRAYFESVRDYSYHFFKVTYDEDCDFIHIIKIYNSRSNDGKPGLSDKSEVGGIYVYSPDLLLNTEYCLRDRFNIRYDDTTTIKGYYKELKIRGFCRDCKENRSRGV